MECEKFEKAKEIKEEIDDLLEINSFLYSNSLYIELQKLDTSNNWMEKILSSSIKDKTVSILKQIVTDRIDELDKQFKEL